MRLKKLGAALVVVAALGAVLASSAFAAATTTDVKWYTGSSPGTELVGSETVSVEQVGTLTQKSGGPVVIHATGTNCIGCKIENSAGTAVGSGQLEFTGVTVVEPMGCTVTPPTIKTKPLSWQADWMIGTTNYWRFVPTAGVGTAFVQFELGGLCHATITHKGSLFVQTANATGTQAVSQQVTSSEAINSTAGGVTQAGTEPGVLEGTFNFKLSGAKAGTAFGTH